jgi:hypothetical protein
MLSWPLGLSRRRRIRARSRRMKPSVCASTSSRGADTVPARQPPAMRPRSSRRSTGRRFTALATSRRRFSKRSSRKCTELLLPARRPQLPHLRSLQYRQGLPRPPWPPGPRQSPLPQARRRARQRPALRYRKPNRPPGGLSRSLARPPRLSSRPQRVRREAEWLQLRRRRPPLPRARQRVPSSPGRPSRQLRRRPRRLKLGPLRCQDPSLLPDLLLLPSPRYLRRLCQCRPRPLWLPQQQLWVSARPKRA